MWWLYMLKYTSIVKFKYVCICIYIVSCCNYVHM